MITALFTKYCYCPLPSSSSDLLNISWSSLDLMWTFSVILTSSVAVSLMRPQWSMITELISLTSVKNILPSVRLTLLNLLIAGNCLQLRGKTQFSVFRGRFNIISIDTV